MKRRTKIAIPLVVVGIVISLVVFLIIPIVGFNSMLYPKHEQIYMYPSNKGMIYENVTFSTIDELELKGWFIHSKNVSNSNANTTIIILHGHSHSKAWMLDHYGVGFYNQSYQMFFFDSRNRGESPDTAFGNSFGKEEVKDVQAAIKYVKSRTEVNGSKIVLFGESEGGSTILLYTSTTNDVAALISDSAWAYGDQMIVQAYSIRSGFPWLIFGQITVALLEAHYGFSFADISPADVVSNLTVPTYIIHGKVDLDIRYEDASTIYNKIPATTSKSLWLIDDRGHVESYLESNYFTRIAQFISDNV